MIKSFENTLELKNAVGAAISGKSRLVSFDEMLLILPERKKSRDVRGILKGLMDKDAVELVRGERESWR